MHSFFRDNMSRRSRRLPLVVMCAACLFVASPGVAADAGITPEGTKAGTNAFTTLLEDLRKGRDPHDGSLSAIGWVGRSRRSGDSARADASVKCVQLAAAILSTRDVGVDVDQKVALWPEFRGRMSDGNPIFAGTDPDSIGDRAVREAYREALYAHQEMLKQLNRERKKKAESDYCIRRACESLSAATDREFAERAVKKGIADLPDAAWVKDYLSAAILTRGVVP